MTIDVAAEKFFGIAPSTAKRLVGKLSPREKEVLRYHAIGLLHFTMAKLMGIKRQSTETYLENVVTKTGVPRKKLPAMYFASKFHSDLMLVTDIETGRR